MTEAADAGFAYLAFVVIKSDSKTRLQSFPVQAWQKEHRFDHDSSFLMAEIVDLIDAHSEAVMLDL